MPAKKHHTLIDRKESNAIRAARIAAEMALTPKTQLTLSPPAALKGHAIAIAMWKRIIELQNETQAAQDGKPIITPFDANTLSTYCKLIEEERKLEEKVRELDKAQKSLLDKANKIKLTKDNFKEWVSMWQQVNGLTNNYKGMDARLDGKRKHILALEQSMYLTPRARAGVTPPGKTPEEPKSEMDKMLDE